MRFMLLLIVAVLVSGALFLAEAASDVVVPAASPQADCNGCARG